MNYADYKYYTDTYKGVVLDTASFERYARNATVYIKMLTFNRVDDSNIPDEVKMCCCEVAEKNYEADKSRHVGISSEKVGDYSVTYENNANIDMKLAKDCNEIIQKWLLMTGLLYRGYY